MMMMKYKDYLADVQFDDEIGIFHREAINIRNIRTAHEQWL